MKKMLKRTITAMLAVVMVFGGASAGLTNRLGGLNMKASAAHIWQVGDIGTFGSYPQTRVTDATLLTALNAQTLSWVSYGYYSGTGDYGTMTQSDYMKYADVTYGGNKYRAVKFTSYRPYWTCYTSSTSNSMQDENGYSPNTTYWFKYEPLKWRVLNPSTGLVMCETLIDSQAYSNTIYWKDIDGDGSGDSNEYFNNSAKTIYANDYATSSVRTWLNGLFLQTAFTGTEQSAILTTALDNSAWPGYSQYNSASTNDKLFFLSYSDSINTAYGFSSSTSTNDTARRAQGSDYAKCQGLYTYSSAGEYYGNSHWWLRSPGYDSRDARNVNNYGHVLADYSVDDTFIGVRPAFKISNLSYLNSASSGTAQTTPSASTTIPAEKNTAAAQTTTAPAIPAAGTTIKSDAGLTVYVVNNYFQYIVIDGEIGIYRYIGGDSDVTVPQTIQSMTVTGISGDAFDGTQAKVVRVPDTVVDFGKNAFGEETGGDIQVVCSPDSAAERYAADNGIHYVYVDETTEPAAESETERSPMVTVMLIITGIMILAAVAAIGFILFRRKTR